MVGVRGWTTAVATAVLLACGVATAQAQGDARAVSMTGQVVDPTGAAVPQASVTARRLSNGVSRLTSVNAQGAFSITGLEAGDYEVTAAADGFAASMQRMSLRAGDTRLRFQLRVGDLTEDVVVLAGEIA